MSECKSACLSQVCVPRSAAPSSREQTGSLWCRGAESTEEKVLLYSAVWVDNSPGGQTRHKTEDMLKSEVFTETES